MNPTVKDKWLEALRSGEYEQGRDALYMQGKHCCLGVLCDVYAKETGEGSFAPPHIDSNPWTFECAVDGDDSSLPAEVLHWSGLSDSSGGRVKIGEKFDWLTGHNDSGIPFAQLADAIEAQL